MAKVNDETFNIQSGIPQLPSNSIGGPSEDISEEVEDHQVEQVVEAKMIEEKDSFIKKLRRSMFDGDDTKSVTDYVIFDVAVPAIKDLISEMASSAVDMILFGEVRGHARKKDTPGDKPSYSAYYANPRRGGGQIQTRTIPENITPWGAGHGANERMIFANRTDAEDVLERMTDIMERYGVVTVADYLGLCGIRTNYTDNSYGWVSMSDIRRCTIRRVNDGFTIDTPYAIELRR